MAQSKISEAENDLAAGFIYILDGTPGPGKSVRSRLEIDLLFHELEKLKKRGYDQGVQRVPAFFHLALIQLMRTRIPCHPAETMTVCLAAIDIRSRNLIVQSALIEGLRNLAGPCASRLPPTKREPAWQNRNLPSPRRGS